MSEAYLTLEAGGRRFPLAAGQSWAIGRGDGCAVMLDSRSVSRLHALIQRRDAGDFSLVDLGSRNGSFVNNHRVSLPVVLNDKDRLIFGDQELAFRNPAYAGSLVPAVSTDDRNAPTTQMHTHSLATIVVVDIRDFTPLAQTVSEALLSQAIGTWFLRVGQVTQRLGSWAQKYIGDAVMAVWVHDNRTQLQAELVRALRAVNEINVATSEISRLLPLPGPLRIGAGVNTGPAILGGFEYTALGDTVNAAFRLEAATKGLGLGVALGERTFAELGLAPMGPFQRRQVVLKGYEASKTAWAISFEDLEIFLAQCP
ncbi:MAG: adenylate/guanylate cyclase domain-containing protein [Acidobacteriia bacterium]|nr:adenylate/guanylate cyclase domain-containing protein [Terriglobia bacterium]